MIVGDDFRYNPFLSMLVVVVLWRYPVALHTVYALCRFATSMPLCVHIQSAILRIEKPIQQHFGCKVMAVDTSHKLHIVQP